MTQVYGAECNGCGKHTEMAAIYAPAQGWHRHTLSDINRSMQVIDLCETCWPTLPFSRFIPAAVEDRADVKTM